MGLASKAKQQQHGEPQPPPAYQPNSNPMFMMNPVISQPVTQPAAQPNVAPAQPNVVPPSQPSFGFQNPAVQPPVAQEPVVQQPVVQPPVVQQPVVQQPAVQPPVQPAVQPAVQPPVQPAVQPAQLPQPIQHVAPNMYDTVNTVIRTCITKNGLQAFYPENRIVDLVDKISKLDWRGIADNNHISLELASHLAALSLFDVAMLVDDSGSMSFEENGTRISDMAVILEKVAGIITLFDTDGITVRFLNSNEHGDGICNENDVKDLVKKVKFTGNTMVGTNLRKKILEPFAYTGTMNKPIIVITITDGDPSGEPRDTLKTVIEQTAERMAKTQYGVNAVSFEFVQVGRDKRAEAFLQELDNLSTIRGGIPVGDLVDCVSYYENEEEQFKAKGVELTPELYVIKLILGSVDEYFDNMD